MKKIIPLLFITCVLCSFDSCSGQSLPVAPPPVSVIYDTDIGGDYDDVGALAVLHALADSGEVNILATLSCNLYETAYSVPNIEIINTYFKRPDIPLGAPRKSPNLGGDHDWNVILRAKYPHTVKSSADAPDALQVYRRILSNQPDTSVHIITVGYLTNLADLLHSPPDEFSDLDGKSLVKKKVRRLVSMAGTFPEGGIEFNVWADSVASRIVFNEWPTPILLCGNEVGGYCETGLRLIATDVQDNPIKDIYSLCLQRDVNGHGSCDQATVLMAGVRDPQKYFSTVKGRMYLVARGRHKWQDDPDGPHEYIVSKIPRDELTILIEDLMMHLP